jgi:hypothetical protein
MVELLMGLAISASLLTAVAAAFTASTTAIESNDEVFRATQAARVSMLHLLAEIRNGTIDENSTSTSMRLITSGTESVLPQDRTYRFESGKLNLITNSIDDDEDFVLARNVVTANPSLNSHFAYDIGQDANHTDVVVRVAVTLVVRVNNNEIRLTGTASPRQYLSY